MPDQPSYRVRSLSRGLSVLAALNARGSSTLAELSLDVGLAKPTTFRILKTLLEDEYVTMEVGSGIYRPAARVSSLSSEFEETAWFVEHTRSHLAALAEKLVWPLSVSTLARTRILVRGNTDSTNALAVGKLKPGMTLPILETASGRVLLAFSIIKNATTFCSAYVSPMTNAIGSRATTRKLNAYFTKQKRTASQASQYPATYPTSLQLLYQLPYKTLLSLL